MSVLHIKDALGAASVTMRYDGAEQIFAVDGVEYRVPGELHTSEIVAHLKGQQEKAAMDQPNETAELVNVLRDKTILTRMGVLEVEIFLERLKELGLQITQMETAPATDVPTGAWVTTASSSNAAPGGVPSPEVTGGEQADHGRLVTPAQVAVHPEMAHDQAPAAEGKLERTTDTSIPVVESSAKIEGDDPVAEMAPMPQKPQDQSEPAAEAYRAEAAKSVAEPATVEPPPPNEPAPIAPTMTPEPVHTSAPADHEDQPHG